jgi:polyisoprenoid-binding protein YceI
MRETLKRPRAVIVGLAAIAAVVIVVAIVTAIYVFGAGGKTTTASGTVTVPTLAPTDGATLFTIDNSSSKATFTIDEVLFGNPNTVVGETDKVAGQILVNAQDSSKSRVGEIKIDVSTLVTDNDLRNRTLQGRILQTDTAANQYATFVAKSITGLPESIAVGQQVSFKITGDLTIHQIMKTVAFDATVKAVSDKQITGTASTTVKYSDFGISVPDVPSVTGLGDMVKLALDFTANAG